RGDLHRSDDHAGVSPLARGLEHVPDARRAGGPLSLPGSAVCDHLHDPGDPGVHKCTTGGPDRVPKTTLKRWMRSAPWNSSRTYHLVRSSRSGRDTSLT